MTPHSPQSSPDVKVCAGTLSVLHLVRSSSTLFSRLFFLELKYQAANKASKPPSLLSLLSLPLQLNQLITDAQSSNKFFSLLSRTLDT